MYNVLIMPSLYTIVGGIVLLAGLALLVWGVIGDRPRGRRRCPKCWYDLSGITGLKCPECGREAMGERNLHRTRRRSLPIAAALVLIASGFIVAAVPTFQSGTWVRVVPSTVLVWVWPTSVRVIEDPSSNWRQTATILLDETNRRAEGPSLRTWQRRTLIRRAADVYERTANRDARLRAYHQLLYSSAYAGEVVPRLIEIAINRGYDEHLLITARMHCHQVLPDPPATIERLFTALESGQLTTLAHADIVSTLIRLEADEQRLLPQIQAMISPDPPRRGTDRSRAHLHGIRNLARLPGLIDVTLPILIELSSSDDRATAESAVNAMEDLGPLAAPALPALIEILQRPETDASMRRWVNFTLASIGPAAAEATDALAAQPEETDPHHQLVQRITLLRIQGRDDEAIDLLATEMPDVNHDGRTGAAGLLRRFTNRSDRALPLLAPLLTHDDTFFRMQILREIARHGPAAVEILPEIADCMAATDDLEELRAALFVLENLGPELHQARPIIRQFARHESWYVRNPAQRLLLQLESK